MKRSRLVPFACQSALILAVTLAISACGAGGNTDSNSSDTTAGSTNAEAAPSADSTTVVAGTDTPPTGSSPATTTDPTAVVSVAADPAIAAVEPVSAPAASADMTPTVTAAAVTTAAADIPGGVGVYVDASTGNDGNPGTAAQPWKTLAKLVGITLPSGQGIFLKCGSTWREQVMLDGRQFADGTVISGYGPCSTAKATVTGADNFSSGWAKVGNVWQRSVPLNTPKISRLNINLVPQRTAQWPNYGGVGHEYAIAKAGMASSKSVLSMAAADAAALSGRDFVGAKVFVKSEPWLLEAQAISAADGAGNLTLSAATQYAMEGGDGYVLQDKLWMLDAPGEFFHDTASGKLYVWPSDPNAQANLNAYFVEGSVRDEAFQLRNRSGLTLRYLAFLNGRNDGLVLTDTPNTVVDTVAASGNGRAGIRLSSSGSTRPSPAGTVIRNSAFVLNGYAGIDGSSIANVSVTANLVTDNGMSPNVGNATAAIVIGPTGLAQSNTVRRSAQAGINFSGTGGSRVLGNLVEDSCLRFSDAAAIKTWNGTKNFVNQSSLVEGNTVARVTGNSEGSVGGAADWSAGIYLDDFTQGATVRGNVVMAAPVGIMVHNASKVTVESNRVSLTSRAALFVDMDQTDADYMTGNVFRSNQWATAATSTGTFPVLPTASAPQAVLFWHVLKGAAAISASGNAFSGNQFALPNGTSMPVAQVRGGGADSMLTLASWRQLNPLDVANATTPQFRTSQLVLDANLIASSDFSAGIQGWLTYSANASPRGSISAGTQAGCTGTCAIMRSGSASDALISPAFSMVTGGLYYLTYDAALATNGTLGRPNVRRNADPKDSFIGLRISSSAGSGTAGSVLSQETYFTATSSAPAVLSLSAAAGTVVGFDRVSLRRVLGYTLANQSEWISYANSDPSVAKTVDCSTLGWPAGCVVSDLNGSTVTLPTTLAAGTGATYLRINSSWRLP